MARNVTIRLDEAVLKRCRHLAVERLDKGFNLGGRPLSREEIYER